MMAQKQMVRVKCIASLLKDSPGCQCLQCQDAASGVKDKSPGGTLDCQDATSHVTQSPQGRTLKMAQKQMVRVKCIASLLKDSPGCQCLQCQDAASGVKDKSPGGTLDCQDATSHVTQSPQGRTLKMAQKQMVRVKCIASLLKDSPGCQCLQCQDAASGVKDKSPGGTLDCQDGTSHVTQSPQGRTLKMAQKQIGQVRVKCIASLLKNSPGGTLQCQDAASGVKDKSPGGTLDCQDGTSHVTQSPQGRTLKSRKTKTASGSGCSRPKKARCSNVKATRELLDYCSSEDSDESDNEDDPYIDFRAMRRNARLAQESDDECEVNDEEGTSLDTLADVRVEGVKEVNDIKQEDDVNESVEEDTELRARAQDFVGLNDFTWSEDFTTFTGKKEKYLRTPGPSSTTENPVDIFLLVWNKDIMNEIARQTNKYAWEQIAPYTEEGNTIPEPLSMWTETSSEELYRLLGFMILMSVWQKAVISDNWMTGVMGMPDFRRLMSRNRFLLLTRLLHFADNDTVTHDMSSYQKKVHKVKPILDHCNAQFAALYTPSQHLSLDESLLLWKGRLRSVQCIRTKGARFGIKSFELCEAGTGYLLRCLLCAGRNSTMREEPIYSFEDSAAKIVLEIMDGFLDVGHTLVMDNWYDQLSLTRFLKSRGTDVIGTMNARQVHVPNAIKEAKDEKMDRGSQIARHCGDITLIAWKDVKLVTAVSTCHTDARESTLRAGEDIEKPVAILEYNKYMGGVESKDQKLSMFPMESNRGRKWYMKVFKRLLNTSLLNAFIIYQKTPIAGTRLTHRQFRWAVATGLLERFPNTRTSSSIKPNIGEPAPGIPRRLMKGVDHFVVHTERKDPNKPVHKQMRCARCTAAKRRSDVTQMCNYCNVALCIGPCWIEYHTLKEL